MQYGNIRKHCFSSLLPSNDFTYQTNVAGNEPFHSWWGWLVRCETTKVFNEVALKQIHSLRLRFLHNITWLDRRRKNVNKTAFIWGGGGGSMGSSSFVSSGVIDWPLFLWEILVLSQKASKLTWITSENYGHWKTTNCNTANILWLQ